MGKSALKGLEQGTELLSQLDARACLPKAEQQPNAPGLLFCFLIHPEGISSRFSRY
jgi:hypothetical protein